MAAAAVSVYATLFRILKNANNSVNRLANWKYFLVLFVFVSGLIIIGGLLLGNEEESVPMGLVVGFLISSVVSVFRWIRHRRKERKDEKERSWQYQEQLERQNQQYANELDRKDRIISDLRNRNSEMQESRRTSSSSSSSGMSSQYQEWQMERQQEQMRRQEEEDRKKERLENWYRDYVTIDVDFEYHVKDPEYNQDYWDPRNEEIRVSRREAMALIEAGEGAILGRMGYGNWGNIRNFRYKVPYGLYDRPWNC